MNKWRVSFINLNWGLYEGIRTHVVFRRIFTPHMSGYYERIYIPHKLSLARLVRVMQGKPAFGETHKYYCTICGSREHDNHPVVEQTCRWKHKPSCSDWVSTCGQISDCYVISNSTKFCPYCGKRIEVVE